MSIFEGCPITAAGFFCYPLDTLREEKGSQKSFGFRDMKGTWDIVVDKDEACFLAVFAGSMYNEMAKEDSAV